MITRLSSLLAVAMIAGLLSISPSAAITVEVARKCDALVAQGFPPRLPGNPAAGSDKGSVTDQRAFFKRCVANGGKADEGDGLTAKPRRSNSERYVSRQGRGWPGQARP